jgi:hypothetical protein
MLFFKIALTASTLMTLALAPTLGCSSSSSNEPSTSEGPNCTALQICCNELPTGDGGIGSDDPKSDCNTTANNWPTLPAATAESDCASAEAQYEKEGYCKGH